MRDPAPPEPTPKRRTTRASWIAFTLSGAVATGTAYWVNAHRQPQLDHAFELPAIDSTSLTQDFQNRLKALAVEIKVGRDLIANLTQLGRLAHASGLPEAAEVCWTQLTTLEPTSPLWPYYLADLARSDRQDAAERQFLERSIELDPTYAPAYLHLANVFFRQGNLPAAKQAYQQRLAHEPTDPHGRLGLIRIAQREGHKAERFALLQELVNVAPDFPSGHNLLAAELSAAGKIEAAREHRWLGHNAGRWTAAADPRLDQLDEYCFDPGRLYVLVTRDFQLNRHDQALKWLQRVSQLKPHDFANLEFLGDCYLKLGQPAKAIDAMEEALTLAAPTSPSITLFINLTEAYRQNGNNAAALEIAQRGLSHHPQAVELHNAVGVAQSAMGHRAAAVAAFTEALTHQPFDPDANFNLGYTLLELEQEAAGIAAIRRSLTQQPTFGKALTFLGQYELEVGDLGRARESLERLYDAYWGIPEARRLWAEWHFKAGAVASAENEGKAEALYRDGIKIDPDLADSYLGLGALLVSQHRIPEAIAALDKFRDLSPDDPRGLLYLGQAYLANGRNAEARQHLQVALELAEQTGLSATADRCRTLLQGL